MRALVSLLVAGLCLACAGPAAATLPPPTLNLLKNGGVEAGTPATYANAHSCPTDWLCNDNATGVVYGTPTFPTLAESARIGGENAFFAGGPGAQNSAMYQYVDVSFATAEIDGMAAVASLSGCLGGWATDNDRVRLRLETFAAGSMTPSSTTIYIGPDANARGNQTRFLPGGGVAGLPYGTRLLRYSVLAERASSTPAAYNDGYADNLTLTLGTNAARGARASCVAPAGAGGGEGGGGDGRPAPNAPASPARGATLSRLGLSRSRFRAARSGPAVSRRGAPVGTRIGYVLDRDATATFTVARRAAGVRKGRRCVRPPRRRGKGRRCSRTVTVGSFRRASKVGANRIRFSGRLRGRALAPGRYRLSATAGTPPTSAAFAVVR